MAKPVGPTKTDKQETFREKLGTKDIEVGEFKVDELRKIASEYDISGSHDMHKEELVMAINKVRRSEMLQ
jgi:hypothetical protein